MKPDWKLHHIGVVVRDLEKSMAYYEQLGVVEKVSALMTAEGKKAKLLGRFIRVGSMNLELWQPIRGATVQQEFLDAQGEGINHLAYTVDDYEKEYRDFVERQGIRLIFGSKPPISGERAAGYFDTRKAGQGLAVRMTRSMP